MAALTARTRKNEDVAIDVDALKTGLRRLNFRKSESLSALSIVDKNLSNGKAELLLLFY